MLVIEHISTTSRPYQRICPQALDFHLSNKLAVVNDKIVSRDPDVFLNKLQSESSVDLLFSKQKAGKDMKNT